MPKLTLAQLAKRLEELEKRISFIEESQTQTLGLLEQAKKGENHARTPRRDFLLLQRKKP